MKSSRRDIQIFSLSFLDCICCAFGAIILLFVLSKFSEPLILDEIREDLSGRIVRLEEELHEIRGQVTKVNRKLEGKIEQLSTIKKRLARLQGDLSEIEGQFETSKKDAVVQNIIEGQLARARQELSEEMKRLLANRPRRRNPSVGGIPVDSEYIIFIIDTSPSMRNNAWPLVRKKMRETLYVYPKVKGIQVMNGMGRFMFTYYRDKWIPDTPARRKEILKFLTTWWPFDESIPVKGITAAIERFYDPRKKISLYVFGDEYSGGSMQRVVTTVERLNRKSADGARRVRIHAVGFPVMLDYPAGMDNTGDRFATLMRVLCQKNGGTFVGLNSYLP